ncbi:glycosyltransferase family 4 protein [Verrucosispora sp. WMMD573]|uniref:glycosyltransferase family 4 protein n=1 Tax=Verrucosispora sp. WMMD573 TaxID=3015149 RepID=UPI00248AAAED|nr:glycosyltransferase family 4 protein [Verrucosispora sp. WMMD573]WBB51949.1 glycosyltransferase family 4 protein [Verrucosispora sp. WMMD573]
MSHVLIVSVHRIHTGRSGEAVHLRQLIEALRAAGERVTVLDGPMDPGTAGADHGAGLRSIAEQLVTLLTRDRPDAALLWGHLGEETELARRLAAADIPTVLEHPAADLEPVPETLRLVDEVVVPSEFARRLFQSQTGRQARAIEPCLRGCACPPATSRVPVSKGPYQLTFINPEPAKGLGIVMHLVMAASGAGLPFRFRFVEGRWTREHLARLGIGPTDLPGVEIVEYRDDTCALYAETDLLLAPSLWQESFGMVAREAVIHGVPVVATRVGGLPQAVGAGGQCLPPPAWEDDYQVRMTTAEVRAWLAAVVTGLRGAHRRQPALLSRATSDSVRAYRAVLGSSPG